MMAIATISSAPAAARGRPRGWGFRFWRKYRWKSRCGSRAIEASPLPLRSRKARPAWCFSRLRKPLDGNIRPDPLTFISFIIDLSDKSFNHLTKAPPFRLVGIPICRIHLCKKTITYYTNRRFIRNFCLNGRKSCVINGLKARKWEKLLDLKKLCSYEMLNTRTDG